MLAQNFKTAADLGIPEHEFSALATVLGMLERCEIHDFDMGTFNRDCGTPGCICGWARHVDESAFPEVGGGITVFKLFRRPVGLTRLFAIGAVETEKIFDATPAQAAIALRNYLTHG